MCSQTQATTTCKQCCIVSDTLYYTRLHYTTLHTTLHTAIHCKYLHSHIFSWKLIYSLCCASVFLDAIHTSPFLWYILLLCPPSCVPHLPSAGCGWGEEVGPAEPSSTVCAVVLFLPHKELRSIVYVFPIINVVAGVGAANM